MKPFLAERRRYLSPSEKAAVISRQANRCGCGCREPLEVGHIQFDHVLDLAFGGTNDLSNFAALITKHHLVKTNANSKLRAKADRIRAKNSGPRLSAADRQLAKIMDRRK